MYVAPAHFFQCPTHHPATSRSISDAPLEIQTPVIDVNVKGKGSGRFKQTDTPEARVQVKKALFDAVNPPTTTLTL